MRPLPNLPSRVKTALAGRFPAAMRWLQRLKDRCRRLRHGERYMEAIFSRIYRDGAWGDGESRSGWGSTVAQTENIRRDLPALLRRLGAKSLLDAPCGDWNWMRQVDLGGIEYTGIDVVGEIVEANRRKYGGPGRTFLRLDFTRQQVPPADAILCRDTLIHLSLADCLKVMENFKRSGARYLFMSTDPTLRENTDIVTGHWRRLNMQLAPFGFPPPLDSIAEREVSGLCLCVWRMSDL